MLKQSTVVLIHSCLCHTVLCFSTNFPCFSLQGFYCMSAAFLWCLWVYTNYSDWNQTITFQMTDLEPKSVENSRIILLSVLDYICWSELIVKWQHITWLTPVYPFFLCFLGCCSFVSNTLTAVIRDAAFKWVPLFIWGSTVIRLTLKITK